MSRKSYLVSDSLKQFALLLAKKLARLTLQKIFAEALHVVKTLPNCFLRESPSAMTLGQG